MTQYSAAALEDEINKETRATAFNILKGVVLATPFKTGRAKGNWQVSISSPNFSTIERLDPQKSGAATISAELSNIEKAKAINYPVIWITNNLPYLGELNKGTSEQAGAKFIETVIQKVVNK